MLSKPDVEVVYDPEGVATGVRSEGETASAKFVVGDPSAFVTQLPCMLAVLVLHIAAAADGSARSASRGCNQMRIPISCQQWPSMHMSTDRTPCMLN